MTQEDARNKSAEKVSQVTSLAKALKIKIRAEQVITKDSIIKSVVFFTDEEEYDVDKPAPIVREPLEEQKKEDVKDPSVQ